VTSIAEELRRAADEIDRLQRECNRWSDLRDADILKMRTEIERLHTEIKHLKDDHSDCVQSNRYHVGEIVKLKHENEQVRAHTKATLHENRELRAENARLREDHSDCVQSNRYHCSQITRLEAEVDWLREALEWCSGSPDFQPGGQAREGWVKLCKPLLSEDKP
jgi:regulator of replication initiation timing